MLKTQLLNLEPRYHINHPFQKRITRGIVTKPQLQLWVKNRFYYHQRIPQKDSIILSKMASKSDRKIWRKRIEEHDGERGKNNGGIEAWVGLGNAMGVSKEELHDESNILPGVKFAVDAYVNFVRDASWEEGVCSSLTELFAPTIHQSRIDNWPTHYPFIDEEGYRYFKRRLTEAKEDVVHGLEIAEGYATTPEKVQRVVDIVKFKQDVLWCLLDAIEKESNLVKYQK